MRTSFWEYNVKQNACFWLKKVVAGFDKKNRGMGDKENQEKNVLLRTLKKNVSLKTQNGRYYWGSYRESYQWET